VLACSPSTGELSYHWRNQRWRYSPSRRVPGQWNRVPERVGAPLNTQEMFLLTVGLASKGGYTGNNQPWSLAALMFNTIPAVPIFAIFSRYFVAPELRWVKG